MRDLSDAGWPWVLRFSHWCCILRFSWYLILFQFMILAQHTCYAVVCETLKVPKTLCVLSDRVPGVHERSWIKKERFSWRPHTAASSSFHWLQHHRRPFLKTCLHLCLPLTVQTSHLTSTGTCQLFSSNVTEALKGLLGDLIDCKYCYFWWWRWIRVSRIDYFH